MRCESPHTIMNTRKCKLKRRNTLTGPYVIMYRDGIGCPGLYYLSDILAVFDSSCVMFLANIKALNIIPIRIAGATKF